MLQGSNAKGDAALEAADAARAARDPSVQAAYDRLANRYHAQFKTCNSGFCPQWRRLSGDRQLQASPKAAWQGCTVCNRALVPSQCKDHDSMRMQPSLPQCASVRFRRQASLCKRRIAVQTECEAILRFTFSIPQDSKWRPSTGRPSRSGRPRQRRQILRRPHAEPRRQRWRRRTAVQPPRRRRWQRRGRSRLHLCPLGERESLRSLHTFCLCTNNVSRQPQLRVRPCGEHEQSSGVAFVSVLQSSLSASHALHLSQFPCFQHFIHCLQTSRRGSATGLSSSGRYAAVPAALAVESDGESEQSAGRGGVAGWFRR